MNPDSRETVGYFCRWGLLAVASVTALGAAAACVRATTAIHADLHAVLIVPDTVWQEEADRKMNLLGYSLPPLPLYATVSFTSWPGRGLRFMPSHIRHLFMQAGSPPVGIHELTVLGVPHSAFAFKNDRALFQVVPADRDVFLVDARMVRRALVADDEMLRPVLDLLWARGDVVFVHPGPLEAYADIRDAIRRIAPLTPVICAVNTRKPDDRMPTFWVTWSSLRRKDRKLMFLTDDAALAVATARQGQRTHVISTEEVNRGKGWPVFRHESLAKFKDYWAAKPISDTTER